MELEYMGRQGNRQGDLGGCRMAASMVGQPKRGPVHGNQAGPSQGPRDRASAVRGYLLAQNAGNLEGHDLAGLEAHGLAGLGITPLPRLLPADHELAETADEDMVFGGQGGLYDVDDGLHVPAGLDGGKGRPVGYAGDYFFFGNGHEGNPDIGRLAGKGRWPGRRSIVGLPKSSSREPQKLGETTET